MSPHNQNDDNGGGGVVDEDMNPEEVVLQPQQSVEKNKNDDNNTTNGSRRRSTSSSNNGNVSKKGNKKPRLFDESGLTDAERRMIRQHQREIQQSLRDCEYTTFDDIEDVRMKNNHVFQTKVCFTREAVLDADNVDLIAAKYAKQIEKQVHVPRFDAMKFVQKLGQKCTNRSATSQYFDWKFLGAEAGICFNALPERVTFLAGTLDHQVPVKAKTVRQARVKSTINDEVEVKPEAVDNKANKGDADKLSAMEKAMRVVRKKLKERTLEEAARLKEKGEVELVDKPDVDLVQFLFNPQSFTQTVENIFNFSFLIKKGDAEIGVRPPLCRTTPSGAYVAHRVVDGDNSSSTQAICRFTMADWRRICNKHCTTKYGDLPHRTGTKHERVS